MNYKCAQWERCAAGVSLSVYIYHDQTQLCKNVQGELLLPTPVKKKNE